MKFGRNQPRSPPIVRVAGLAVTPDRSKVYVTNEAPGSVSVIATASNTVTATVGTGRKPYGVAVTPDRSKVYVAHAVTLGFVAVVATASNTVTPAIRVGEDPIAFGMFIGPAPTSPPSFAGDAWVFNCVGQSIAALDPQFGGRNAAAAALGFPDVKALENSV